jgi:hypothetical protein
MIDAFCGGRPHGNSKIIISQRHKIFSCKVSNNVFLTVEEAA